MSIRIATIRIATISIMVGLIVGATLFGAAQSEAELVFSSSPASEQTDTDVNLVQQQLDLDTSSLTESVANTGADK